MRLWQKIQKVLRSLAGKQYRRLEFRAASWPEADQLIRDSVGKPESEQWVIAREEDFNYPNYSPDMFMPNSHIRPFVYLERREEIKDE